MVLNIKSTSMFFLQGNMMGMVRFQTSFILSSCSLETGSPLIGSAERMNILVVLTSVTHICPIHRGLFLLSFLFSVISYKMTDLTL